MMADGKKKLTLPDMSDLTLAVEVTGLGAGAYEGLSLRAKRVCHRIGCSTAVSKPNDRPILTGWPVTMPPISPI